MFSKQNCLKLKSFLDWFSPFLFLNTIVLGHNFFGSKFFLRPKLLLHQNFLNQTFFWDKNSLGPKLIRTNNFIGKFSPFLYCLELFWTKKLFSRKIFLFKFFTLSLTSLNLPWDWHSLAPACFILEITLHLAASIFCRKLVLTGKSTKMYQQ